VKKGNLLPILLIAGAAYAFMAFRRRPGVTVTADMPIRQTAEEFEADQRAAAPSLIDKATDIIKNVFTKTPQRKAAAQAQRQAVRIARKKRQDVKAVKSVTQKLAKGQIRFSGFRDQDVLC
jgi:uncharacterized protein YajQ (UPF0234 family)